MEQVKLSTKQRILEEALTLFSIKGYEPVTVAEIADAVGIKAPSLYKHYESKQDIFNAILAEMESRYEKQAASMQLNGRQAGDDKAFFMNINDEKLIEIANGLFLFFLHDDFTCKVRKLLKIEQYKNKELAARFVKQYIDEPLTYHSMLFGMLAGAGLLIDENPQIMALHFYSPIFHLIALCDSSPEREIEAMQIIEQHIRQFSRLYKMRE
jgi:AcrR family transcriptional regulator